MKTESLSVQDWKAALIGLTAGLAISCATVQSGSHVNRPQIAQRQAGKAQVYGMKGAVQFSTDGTAWSPARLGTLLRPDAVVRTGERSGADLVLGKGGPLLHLAENSLLGIERLEYGERRSGTVLLARLNLKQGRMAGSIKSWTAGSQCEVVVPTRTISVLEKGEFEIWSEGRVVAENCVVQTKEVKVEPKR